MTSAPALDFESIKLQLIRSHARQGQAQKDILSVEAVRYLIRSLEYADQAFSNEIENVLTKAGASSASEVMIQELVKSLSSDNVNVKSTCAMVLIRLGQPSVKAVQGLYATNSLKGLETWIAEFILAELHARIPAVAAPETLIESVTILPLEKVG